MGLFARKFRCSLNGKVGEAYFFQTYQKIPLEVEKLCDTMSFHRDRSWTFVIRAINEEKKEMINRLRGGNYV